MKPSEEELRHLSEDGALAYEELMSSPHLSFVTKMIYKSDLLGFFINEARKEHWILSHMIDEIEYNRNKAIEEKFLIANGIPRYLWGDTSTKNKNTDAQTNELPTNGYNTQRRKEKRRRRLKID